MSVCGLEGLRTEGFVHVSHDLTFYSKKYGENWGIFWFVEW